MGRPESANTRPMLQRGKMEGQSSLGAMSRLSERKGEAAHAHRSPTRGCLHSHEPSWTMVLVRASNASLQSRAPQPHWGPRRGEWRVWSELFGQGWVHLGLIDPLCCREKVRERKRIRHSFLFSLGRPRSLARQWTGERVARECAHVPNLLLSK
ncbi:hypothetical protein C8Q80DRAFT_858316 [Daedaleopsis nitida]|nr:hypothetical protein C8Q80DRAFT_858316 [Daedaleopsis nitida]